MLSKGSVNWGVCPPNPRVLPPYPQDSLEAGASSARTRRIPAAGSALGVRPRRALSSAQVTSAYQRGNVGQRKNKENPPRRIDLTLPSHGSDGCQRQPDSTGGFARKDIHAN